MEGTIEPLEKVFVEEHLKICRECRRELTYFKLLHFEMDSLTDIEEIPLEVEDVRCSVLAQLFDSTEGSYGIKDFVRQQRESLEIAYRFKNYIPGKDIIIKSIEGANYVVKSISKNVVKNGLKIIQERT